MRLTPVIISIVAGAILLAQCDMPRKKKEEPSHPQRPAPPVWKKPAQKISYHAERAKEWSRKKKDSLTSAQQKIIMVVNRVDMANLPSLDSLIIPNDLSGDIVYYLPFPLHLPSLDDVSKIVFFSYPAQAFAAYEYGNLVYAGPSNMGRKKDPTPTGLYFTNWKAEETTSTFNDEWILKWNFNIQNKAGIGWHQYALPGYPASNSCLRLLEDDARFLYKWADEWKLKGTDSIILKGTPVVVFGAYPFDGRKPWSNLVADPHILDISAGELEDLVKPHLQEILNAQEKRWSFVAKPK
ncbi:MAG: L,D-transpeptidase [Sphingobacteriales bacterium]|nr:L,D-transpeptidase [Sphingobacteriales bacterium]OJV99440.1 MAG: hypothetical protein BGO52_12325 [Sphingobacteriales bacterium 44-61]